MQDNVPKVMGKVLYKGREWQLWPRIRHKLTVITAVAYRASGALDE